MVSLLALARGTVVGAFADLPSDASVAVAGWGVRFSGGSLDSAGDVENLPYKVGRNTALVQYTTLAPAGAVTLSLGLDDGKVTADGYRADSNGQSLSLAFQRKVESVAGLAFSLRGSLSRQSSDTVRSNLSSLPDASVREALGFDPADAPGSSVGSNVGSRSFALGAGVGYAKSFETLSLRTGLQLIAFRSKVDAFAENSASSLDALDVGMQEDNGAALVVSIGIDGKVSENLTLGTDLSLTSFGGSELHQVSSSVLTENTRTSVTHEATGANILKLGFSGAYQLDPQSSITLGVGFEGDAGLSGGFRADLGYRRNF